MFWIWLTILILFILIEFTTEATTTIWFIIASLVALLLSIFVDEFLIQFIVFTVISIFLFVQYKNQLNDLINKLNIHAKKDKLIDKKGLVTKEINKNSSGIVKIGKKKIDAIAKKKITKSKEVIIVKKIGSEYLVEEVNAKRKNNKKN